MALQLVLVKQDSQKLLISHLMGSLDPLLQLIYVQISLLPNVERSLQRYVQNPVLLFATATYKVDSFTCLKNFVGQLIRQKGGNHDVVQLVPFGPQFVISDVEVGFHKKLLKGVIDFTGQHPLTNH